MAKTKAEKVAKKETEQILKLMKVDGKVSIELQDADKDSDNDNKYLNIHIEGEELGALIGFRGRNLSSLQYIIGLIIKQNIDDEERENLRILLDVNDYKESREGKVKEIAEKYVETLRESEENEIEMHPMKPAERRIIHMMIKEIDDIESDSVDEGRDRRVKLIKKSK